MFESRRWWRPGRLAMTAGLIVILWGETAHPGAAGLHGAELHTSIALAVASVCWAAWTFTGPFGGSTAVLALTSLTGLAGSVLLVVHPAMAVFWFTFWACVAAGVGFSRRAGVALTAACCGILLAGYLGHRGDALASFAAVTFVGYVLGRNRKLVLDAADERERAATLNERGRIARELHDVLAHSLTGLSLQVEAASAALETTGDVQRALSHLDRAGTLVRSGQEEAVAAVRTLREGDVAVHAMVEGLIEGFQRTGAAATLTTTGTPRAVPAAPGLAIYRLVQEALTNAGKHAPGIAVAVGLAFTDDALSVSVTNDVGGAVDPVSGGQGLVGMRERIAAVGGTLTAGPAGAHWQVRAQVGA